MKHEGDITKLEGWFLDPVDILVGGSPCQDLSVAGLRKGLRHSDIGDEETTRSGLFVDQVRLAKEIREYDAAVRPDVPAGDRKCRYLLWENVEGAFSSNGGGDFAAVLEEIIHVVEPKAPPVSVPAQGWPKSGYLYDELGAWSLAWRTHDAQYWGVAQRRKRISLLADFGGLSAGAIMFDPQYRRKAEDADGVETFLDTGEGERCGSEILLEPSRLPWHFTAGAEAGQAAPGDAEGGSGDAGSYTLKVRGGVERDSNGRKAGKGALIQTELSGTLGVSQDQTLFQKAYNIGSYASNAWKSDNPQSGVYEADLAKTLDALGCGYPACNQGGTAVVQVLNDQGGAQMAVSEDLVGTLRAEAHGHEPVILERHHSNVVLHEAGVSPTLQAGMGEGGNNIPMILDGKQVGTDLYNGAVTGDVAATLTANSCSSGGASVTSPTNQSNPHPGDPSHTLSTDSRNYLVIENHPNDSRVKIKEDGIRQTLSGRMGTGGGNTPLVMDVGFFQVGDDVQPTQLARQYKDPAIVVSPTETAGQYAVRRLTPRECERLQGFPDDWTLETEDWTDTQGKVHKGNTDSARYKALGNSIALPYWFWLIRRISAQYDRPATMGSLFDGIGGFPLCWEYVNGKGTALWASEIEEFPIHITKKHFPE